MELQKVKAVLFDLDGTLLDTVLDIGACVNDVMRRYGYPERDAREYERLVGHGAHNLIEKSVPEGTPASAVDEVWRSYVAHYCENCTRYATYYDGVREFLSFLTERGCKLGVITNKSQPTAERIMAHYFPDTPFAVLWGNNGVRPLKPSPDSAVLACETLGVAPDEVMFVGDGDTDMAFASKAGFLACGVTWGYRPRQMLLDFGADFLVDSFAELQKKMIGEK